MARFDIFEQKSHEISNLVVLNSVPVPVIYEQPFLTPESEAT